MKTVKTYKTLEYLTPSLTSERYFNNYSRLIAISQSYFLTYIILENNTLELISWAYLQALIYIKQKNGEKDDRIQLFWRSGNETVIIKEH